MRAGFCVIFLALLAIGGCRSRDGVKRDYLSINISSKKYARESFVTPRKIRKESIYYSLDSFGNKERGKRMRRESRKFLRDTIFEGQWDEFHSAFKGAARDLKWRGDFGYNARFGWLDTGE